MPSATVLTRTTAKESGSRERPVRGPVGRRLGEQLARLEPAVQLGVRAHRGVVDAAHEHVRRELAGLESPMLAMIRTASLTTADW